MNKFDGNIPDIQKLNDQKLTQELIPARFIPPTPPGKVYIFDSSDSFNLTYDELVEIVSKARNAGPRVIPILGTIGD